MSIAELEVRLDKLGLDQDSRAWLIKALHPAGPSSSPGMPDESYIDVYRPEFRSQLVISAPSSLTTGTWDCILWRPGGDVNQIQYATAAGGFDFRSTTAFALAAGTISPISQTLSPINSALFTFPTATGATYTPATVQTVGTYIPTSGYCAWRTQYASITAYLTASALSDQGTVYAGQFDRPFKHGGITTTGSPTVVALNMTTNVPMNEVDMVSVDPEVYVAQARQGVYLPMRLTGPTQPYRYGFSQYGNSSSTPSGTVLAPDYILKSFVPGQAGVSSQMPLLAYNTIDIPIASTYPNPGGPKSEISGVNTAGGIGYYDTDYDAISQGIVIFRGLSLSATVTVKGIVGMEIIPRYSSPEVAFVSKAVKYSPRAMEAYYALVQELPDAFPASYNGFGTIISAIARVAGSLWPVLKRGLIGFAGALAPGMPVAIQGAKTVLRELREEVAKQPHVVKTSMVRAPEILQRDVRASRMPRNAERPVVSRASGRITRQPGQKPKNQRVRRSSL